jgi:adenylate cyclase class 2
LNAEQYALISADLAELNAEFTGEDFEENTLYDGGILTEQAAVLRVRKIEGKTILTYKRRIQNDSDIKHQIEFETAVENAEELENIIENLGFQKSLVYEKRRKTWKFRQTEIVLDELPFGFFMEIEGEIMAIKEAEMFLGAEEYVTEHETYPHLTLKFGKQNGNIIESRFTT